jgi:hypothetical protein
MICRTEGDAPISLENIENGKKIEKVRSFESLVMTFFILHIKFF